MTPPAPASFIGLLQLHKPYLSLVRFQRNLYPREASVKVHTHPDNNVAFVQALGVGIIHTW